MLRTRHQTRIHCSPQQVLVLLAEVSAAVMPPHAGGSPACITAQRSMVCQYIYIESQSPHCDHPSIHHFWLAWRLAAALSAETSLLRARRLSRGCPPHCTPPTNCLPGRGPRCCCPDLMQRIITTPLFFGLEIERTCMQHEQMSALCVLSGCKARVLAQVCGRVKCNAALPWISRGHKVSTQELTVDLVKVNDRRTPRSERRSAGASPWAGWPPCLTVSELCGGKFKLRSDRLSQRACSFQVLRLQTGAPAACMHQCRRPASSRSFTIGRLAAVSSGVRPAASTAQGCKHVSMMVFDGMGIGLHRMRA